MTVSAVSSRMLRALRRGAPLLLLAASQIAATPPAAPPAVKPNEAKPVAPVPVKAPTSTLRWTDETPDAMIELARARAVSGSEREVVAAIATILALAERGEHGLAKRALEEIANKSS